MAQVRSATMPPRLNREQHHDAYDSEEEDLFFSASSDGPSERVQLNMEVPPTSVPPKGPPARPPRSVLKTSVSQGQQASRQPLPPAAAVGFRAGGSSGGDHSFSFASGWGGAASAPPAGSDERTTPTPLTMQPQPPPAPPATQHAPPRRCASTTPQDPAPPPEPRSADHHGGGPGGAPLRRNHHTLAPPHSTHTFAHGGGGGSASSGGGSSGGMTLLEAATGATAACDPAAMAKAQALDAAKPQGTVPHSAPVRSLAPFPRANGVAAHSSAPRPMVPMSPGLLQPTPWPGSAAGLLEQQQSEKPWPGTVRAMLMQPFPWAGVTASVNLPPKAVHAGPYPLLPGLATWPNAAAGPGPLLPPQTMASLLHRVWSDRGVAAGQDSFEMDHGEDSGDGSDSHGDDSLTDGSGRSSDSDDDPAHAPPRGGGAPRESVLKRNLPSRRRAYVPVPDANAVAAAKRALEPEHGPRTAGSPASLLKTQASSSGRDTSILAVRFSQGAPAPDRLANPGNAPHLGGGGAALRAAPGDRPLASVSHFGRRASAPDGFAGFGFPSGPPPVVPYAVAPANSHPVPYASHALKRLGTMNQRVPLPPLAASASSGGVASPAAPGVFPLPDFGMYQSEDGAPLPPRHRPKRQVSDQQRAGLGIPPTAPRRALQTSKTMPHEARIDEWHEHGDGPDIPDSVPPAAAPPHMPTPRQPVVPVSPALARLTAPLTPSRLQQASQQAQQQQLQPPQLQPASSAEQLSALPSLRRSGLSAAAAATAVAGERSGLFAAAPASGTVGERGFVSLSVEISQGGFIESTKPPTASAIAAAAAVAAAAAASPPPRSPSGSPKSSPRRSLTFSVRSTSLNHVRPESSWAAVSPAADSWRDMKRGLAEESSAGALATRVRTRLGGESSMGALNGGRPRDGGATRQGPPATGGLPTSSSGGGGGGAAAPPPGAPPRLWHESSEAAAAAKGPPRLWHESPEAAAASAAAKAAAASKPYQDWADPAAAVPLPPAGSRDSVLRL